MGETPRVATEVYLPVGYRSRWFVAPHAQFQIRTLPLADENEHILAEYRVRSTDYRPRSRPRARQLRRDPRRRGAAPSARRACASAIRSWRRRNSITHDFFGEFRYDSVDDVNFPRPRRLVPARPGRPSARARGDVDDDADLLVYDQLYAHSWGRNTAILWASAGTRLDNDIDIVRSYFSLGGFLNMSGVTPETLVGPHYAIAARHLLPADRRRRARVPQRAGVPRCVDRAGQCVELAAATSHSAARRTNGSVFLGLDTLLGPVYFATGFDDDGGSAYTCSSAGLFDG